jgi:hypothetical protein
MKRLSAAISASVAAGILFVLPVARASADPICHRYKNCTCHCPGDRTAQHEGHLDIQCPVCNPNTWYCPQEDRIFTDAPRADGTRPGPAAAELKKLEFRVHELRDKQGYWRSQRERWQAAMARGEQAEREIKKTHKEALAQIDAIAAADAKQRKVRVGQGVAAGVANVAGNALGAASIIPGFGAWLRAYAAAAGLGTAIGTALAPDNAAEIQRGRDMVNEWLKNKMGQLKSEKETVQQKLDEATTNERAYGTLLQQAQAAYDAAQAARKR